MPLDEQLDHKLGNVEQLAVDEQIYGVPEPVKAVALYYNKALVDTPPPTIHCERADYWRGEIGGRNVERERLKTSRKCHD